MRDAWVHHDDLRNLQPLRSVKIIHNARIKTVCISESCMLDQVRESLRELVPRLDFYGRKFSPRLCAIDDSDQCRSSQYVQGLILMGVATVLVAASVVFFVSTFNRCRRWGICGGVRPSNGCCFTNAFPYRFLLKCKGCCCRKKCMFCNRDVAMFPVDETAEPSIGARRPGHDRFWGYSRCQVICAQFSQIPVAFVCVALTVPALYTAGKGAVAFGSATSRMDVAADLPDADYQASLLRVANIEAWEEPVNVVEVPFCPSVTFAQH